MSRMYDNKPLENLPVHVVKWSGAFDKYFAEAKSSTDNPGVLCDGKIVSQARVHINSSDSTASQARCYILFTSIERAHQRKYDDKGIEQEPNFSETTKVSRGYLNSSYDVTAKGNTDRLSAEEVSTLVRDSKIDDMIADILAKETRKGDIFLLMKEEERLKVEIQLNSLVRIKTAGNSPLIESLVVRDDFTSTVGNFAGDEKLGDSWLEKVAAAKAAKSAEEEPSEIADEEWDD